MLLVGVLLAVAALTGVAVWVVTRRSGAPDPGDVRLSATAAHDVVEASPSLRRLVRRRFDPTSASGLALTAAAAVAALGTFGAGSVLEMVQRHAGLARLDDSAARFGVDHLTPATRRLFTLVTQLGSSRVAIVLALVVMVAEHRRIPARRIFWFLLVVIGGTILITDVAKVLVDRARPDVARLVGFSGPSFPSGHSSTAAATYAALALVLGRGRRRRTKAALATAAAVIAVAVAASRVLLGVHWLTDVIAGVGVGWGWFAIGSILFGGRVLSFGRPVEQLEAAMEAADRADDASPR